MQTVSILEPHYDSIPVFPLPDFVLFPQTTTRLHVFEPRYRTLVEDALASQRLILLVGLRPGWELDYYGAPPCHETGTLARIVNEERLDDGRFNIFVHSLARARLRTWHALSPYRRAAVEVIEDEPVDAAALAAGVEHLVAMVRGLMLQRGVHAAALGAALGSTAKPAILVNRIASVLALRPDVRQSLLELPSALTRAERLADVAGELLLQAPGSQASGEGTEFWIN